MISFDDDCWVRYGNSYQKTEQKISQKLHRWKSKYDEELEKCAGEKKNYTCWMWMGFKWQVTKGRKYPLTHEQEKRKWKKGLKNGNATKWKNGKLGMNKGIQSMKNCFLIRKYSNLFSLSMEIDVHSSVTMHIW